jgi:hypothetical protein
MTPDECAASVRIARGIPFHANLPAAPAYGRATPTPNRRWLRSQNNSHEGAHCRPLKPPLGYLQHSDIRIRFRHGTGWEADDRAR